MKITLDLPSDLAAAVKRHPDRAADIIGHGLVATGPCSRNEFNGLARVLETLATLPSPREVLSLRPSPRMQSRIRQLLRKSREAGFTAAEEREWDRYLFVEHLVQLAKANALAKLKQN